MAFPIARRYPPVQTLRVHTEDQQQVVFDEGAEEEALERQRETELTAFFRHNEEQQAEQQIEERQQPTYVDMPKLYKYDKTKKQWISPSTYASCSTMITAEARQALKI